MFLTENKLQARIHELSTLRYRDRKTLSVFLACEDRREDINPTVPGAEAHWQTMHINETWSGRDLYLWLHTHAEIPLSWENKRIVGLFDFGDTGGGNNSGFESLFYWEGKPFQGVDSNHKEVFLPASAAGHSAELVFRLWSGLEGGGQPRNQTHTLKQAELCWLDEKIDDLVFTGTAILETVKILDPNAPERTKLLQVLQQSFRMIDWADPGSEAFFISVYEARDHLTACLEAMDKLSDVTITCIGHTHIDVAWLWRLKHTREKCARSFSTVMRLMEMFPEYVFLQTQPQLYEYVKEDYPELYESIKERIAEGRWEAGGGMWLEADCNLTSGESLVRQLLIGTRFLKEEFGSECRYLWLPDVFGYSWSLPQILKKSGIHTFMTTKISWNQYNRMPFDTFHWRGIDGSEVLTHFITTPEPWSEPGSWFYTYNGKIIPKTVKGIWDAYRDKEMNQELLLSYGYGDGGGGVNREMLEMRRRLDQLPGLPKVTTGRADAYFDKLQQTVADTNSYIHTWDGELYLEYHRGTYTSQAYNKQMNRKLELAYREAEWLNALQSILQEDWNLYQAKPLASGWKIILRNQFHDIIPGSSIQEVYEDSRVEYEEAWQIGSQIDTQARAAIATGITAGSFSVWNSSPWCITELVTIPASTGMEQGYWLNDAGLRLNAQLDTGIWYIEVKDIPSLGYTTIHFHDDAESVHSGLAPFIHTERGIETPFYQLAWNEAGQLTRIYDKAARREVLAKGANGNLLQVFEDKPLAHEAWDIDIFYQEKMTEIRDCSAIEVMETGSLRAVIRFHWQYRNSTITQNLIVYAANRRIDYVTEVDWHEKQQLLKAAFPVGIRSTEATYDIQFGNVKRPTHWNTSWDWARFESVGHQWADLSDKGYGVSLLNDSKYGYDIKNNVLRLSLIKSATHPDPHADQGLHRFTYALLPHQGDWLAGQTVKQAWFLNAPIRYTKGHAEQPSRSMFALSGDTAMISAVKKAEDSDCIIVRIHDYSGSSNTLELTSGLQIHGWRETNLMEQSDGEMHNDADICFVLEPYEIKTFEIDLRR
ncbi:alpha-mannosidase [Paenibacillus sp. P46E]|uniref:alpha-mannosidase n=1 Tax=Paenibacillus sp. P46E TaxID=1349436 RepID=UPI00093DFB62|nr:alpha-mannosidase [Paenibacillus sp. P46E]OKP94262.1 alpha-mannosidase [Paenibacillus sp. P46E]